MRKPVSSCCCVKPSSQASSYGGSCVQTLGDWERRGENSAPPRALPRVLRRGTRCSDSKRPTLTTQTRGLPDGAVRRPGGMECTGVKTLNPSKPLPSLWAHTEKQTGFHTASAFPGQRCATQVSPPAAIVHTFPEPDHCQGSRTSARCSYPSEGIFLLAKLPRCLEEHAAPFGVALT